MASSLEKQAQRAVSPQLDLTAPHAIGEHFVQVPGGYDHNWVLNQEAGQHAVASFYDPAPGRTLNVTTDQPDG